MSILLMAMSLRKESLNKKLIRNAFDLLKEAQEECELLSFNDYPLPVYNGDDEAVSGIPAQAQALGKKIAEARGVVFATPEYNGGMPGAFKNAFDWVSRLRPEPWRGQHVLLLGASPGMLGANRGLLHSRVPFEAEGSFVFPEMMGLAGADKAFDAEGKLLEAKQKERLQRVLQNFLTHVKKNRS